jgi:transposase
MSTFFVGGKIMNNIRTPEEKEIILKEYLNGKGIKKIEKEYNVRNAQVYRWLEKYEKDGINGLKSNTGKSKGDFKGLGRKKPKDRIEELELELMKKEIEIARLKKGYMVKGVGAEKEFVTTFDRNTK